MHESEGSSVSLMSFDVFVSSVDDSSSNLDRYAKLVSLALLSVWLAVLVLPPTRSHAEVDLHEFT